MAPKKRKTLSSASPPSSSNQETGRSARRERRGYSVAQLGTVFVLLVAVNYFGLSWLQGLEWSSDDSTPDSSAMYRVSGGVEIRHMSSPDERFAEECRDGGVPVVLRKSVVEKWRARRHWTPKYLQSRISRMDGVYQNDNRWFGPYFDATKPLTHLSSKINNYATDISMSSKTFFKKLREPSETEFLYFTGDIDQLGEWTVEDVEPLSELLSLSPQRSSVNVWMGQPHVIAHCHYDGYHNFYAQLYGTKKFTLFSPDSWPGLYPYPFLHPSHAQAQVNLSNPSDIERYPLAGRLRAVEVVLRPGDLLYMPPLWFHHVESMETSISVNVWTDSKQTGVVEDIYSTPLPTEATEWSTSHQKAIATSVLILDLLSEVCRRRKCRKMKRDDFLDNQNLRHLEGHYYFVYQLWTTRYRTLMDRDILPDGVHDGKDSPNKEVVLCERMNREESKIESEAAAAHLKVSGLKQYVVSVAEKMEGLPDNTWELWTGNYIEYLAATAVRVELVGVFLRHFGSCFLH